MEPDVVADGVGATLSKLYMTSTQINDHSNTYWQITFKKNERDKLVDGVFYLNAACVNSSALVFHTGFSQNASQNPRDYAPDRSSESQECLGDFVEFSVLHRSKTTTKKEQKATYTVYDRITWEAMPGSGDFASLHRANELHYRVFEVQPGSTVTVEVMTAKKEESGFIYPHSRQGTHGRRL